MARILRGGIAKRIEVTDKVHIIHSKDVPIKL